MHSSSLVLEISTLFNFVVMIIRLTDKWQLLFEMKHVDDNVEAIRLVCSETFLLHKEGYRAMGMKKGMGIMQTFYIN